MWDDLARILLLEHPICGDKITFRLKGYFSSWQPDYWIPASSWITSGRKKEATSPPVITLKKKPHSQRDISQMYFCTFQASNKLLLLGQLISLSVGGLLGPDTMQPLECSRLLKRSVNWKAVKSIGMVGKNRITWRMVWKALKACISAVMAMARGLLVTALGAITLKTRVRHGSEMLTI